MSSIENCQIRRIIDIFIENILKWNNSGYRVNESF